MNSVVPPLRRGGEPGNRLRPKLLAALRAGAEPLSDQALSGAIQFARITLITGLVFLHYGEFFNSAATPRMGLDPVEHSLATFVNSFVLYFFYSVVPLLSAIAGYLFFSFTSQPERHLPTLIRRRFFSLYVPLVAWNFLYLALLLLLWAYAPQAPLLNALRVDLDSAGLLEAFNAVFAVSDYPLAFQFWFVRDLFVAILCSPMLWLLLRRAPLVGALGLGAVWLSGMDLGIFLRTDVLFFFYIGGLLQLSGTRLEIGARATVVLLAIYLLLIAGRALLPYVYEDSPTGLVHQSIVACTRLTRIVGILAVWGLIQRIAPTRIGRAIAGLGGLSFFLFAFHYPLLVQVKLALWPLLPAHTDGWMLVHYAVTVGATVTIAILVGLLFARLFPSASALMNGGRSVSDAHPHPRRAQSATSTCTAVVTTPE